MSVGPKPSDDAYETLVPCPTCIACDGCDGYHMVSATRRRLLEDEKKEESTEHVEPRDDSDFIQELIDRNNPIPPGTYIIGRTLTIPAKD